MTKNMITTRKGFTLMEILFVVLVIALVVSFALPAIRSVRFDIKNSQAKAALKKFAEARHSFYENSRGWDVKGSFTGNGAKALAAGTCTNKAFTGIPGASAKSDTMPEVGQLFACGLLDWKDFVGLPYTFTSCFDTTCLQPVSAESTYVVATGMDGAGKYQYVDANSYYMYVTTANMQVREHNED